VTAATTAHSSRLSLLSSPPLPLHQLPTEPFTGLYVHIPFCFHKCHYCDFYSITRQTPERMRAFVDRVLAEAQQWRSISPANRLDHITTVFFGGGTPSLLPIAEMLRLISGLRTTLALHHVAEWTIECNPATVDLAYLSQLRTAGVDRLSFGAQSFDRSDLKALERHHDPEDVPRSIDAARQAGFSRINLDLIYAVPGQSLESWHHTLRQALALGTDHLSAYMLTYEENTPLAVKKRLGAVTPAPEDLELQMLRATRTALTQVGLPPYEISNYARPGQECQHNLMYWLGGNYLGLGPSAASHLAGWRWKNRPHLGEWETAVDSRLPAATAIEVERLPPDRREAELAYLMLRLTQGIRFDTFQEKTGHHPLTRFHDAIQKLAPTQTLQVTNDSIRLTDKGVELADAVATEFL
jgi:oxygen-independent coproporphyrinogen-3 oxidase